MSEKHKEKIKQLNLRKPKSRKIKNVKMQKYQQMNNIKNKVWT